MQCNGIARALMIWHFKGWKIDENDM